MEKDEVKSFITQSLFLLMKSCNYEKITMLMIAKRAGVSRRTVYRYFENKNAILNEYFNDLINVYKRKLEYNIKENKNVILLSFEFIFENSNFFNLAYKNNLLLNIYSAIEDIETKKFGIEGDESVVGLRLIEKSLIDKFGEVIGPAVPTDYADSRRTQSLRAFWVKDGSGNLLLYNSTNRPLTGYVNFENNQFTAGIRLVLVLDDDKINRRK